MKVIVYTPRHFKIKKKKTVKKIVLPILIKHQHNPVISPNPDNYWEALQTFNPGAVLIDDKVHLLYRAIGQDGVSRLGYAVSDDGINFENRLPYPVYEHSPKTRKFSMYSFLSGGSYGGCEDPRLVCIDNDGKIYMTYTACDGGLRVGLTSISVDDFINNKWRWKRPSLISPPGEIHKNWLIFPEKIHGKYAVLHSIKPEIQIEYVKKLSFSGSSYIESVYGDSKKRIGCWDKLIRGAGAPPIKTKDGWLLFYHAMDDDVSKYKVGAMLLDLNDPTKILYRSKEPVLEPIEMFEMGGYKPGVVYVTGTVIKDGVLLIYYGCADNHIGIAYSKIDNFLDCLKNESKPVLSKKLITTKRKTTLNVD